jgi:DnaJ-class molecular chaperone
MTHPILINLHEAFSKTFRDCHECCGTGRKEVVIFPGAAMMLVACDRCGGSGELYVERNDSE